MNTTQQYIIYCLDGDNGAAIRKAHIEAHRSYVASAGSKVLLAGPILSNGRGDPVGSLFIITANSFDEAVAFNNADPFRRLQLWKEVTVHPFQIARHSLS